MNIRPYRDGDFQPLVDLFTDSVHGAAAGHYDAVQREAWAPRLPDLDSWRERLNGPRTLVAEADGRDLIGFVSYDPTGHIAFLYVSTTCQGRGVASALYREAEADLMSSGVEELYTEASLVARGFFERQGFRCESEQEVRRRGVVLRRWLMRKTLV